MPTDDPKTPFIYHSVLYKKGSQYLATPEEKARTEHMLAEGLQVNAHKKKPSKEYLTFQKLWQKDQHNYWEELHTAKLTEEAATRANNERMLREGSDSDHNTWIVFALILVVTVVFLIFRKKRQNRANSS